MTLERCEAEEIVGQLAKRMHGGDVRFVLDPYMDNESRMEGMES